MTLLTNSYFPSTIDKKYAIIKEESKGKSMLKKDTEKQMKLFSGTLEELMPKEHFLRELDRLADFDFIYEKLKICIPKQVVRQ